MLWSLLLTHALGCGSNEPGPADAALDGGDYFTAYVEGICSNLGSCCSHAGLVEDPAGCRSFISEQLPNDVFHARACARLITERIAACQVPETQFHRDERLDACTHGLAWDSWEGDEIAAGALSHGGGSIRIGEPCNVSLECEAPQEGFVRCVHWSTAMASDGAPSGGSFCQAVLPDDPKGQGCLVHAWRLVGPISDAQLMTSIMDGTATEVRECGLPGSDTQCFTQRVEERGTCESRLAVGEGCSTDGLGAPQCVEGAHCGENALCVAGPPPPCETTGTCQSDEFWGVCGSLTDGGS